MGITVTCDACGAGDLDVHPITQLNTTVGNSAYDEDPVIHDGPVVCDKCISAFQALFDVDRLRTPEPPFRFTGTASTSASMLTPEDEHAAWVERQLAHVVDVRNHIEQLVTDARHRLNMMRHNINTTPMPEPVKVVLDPDCPPGRAFLLPEDDL
jgi:hypothetical protein